MGFSGNRWRDSAVALSSTAIVATRPPVSRANVRLAWVVLGLLGLHLVALPPHLVHHLGSPESQASECTPFVQGKAAGQGIVEPALSVPGPVFAGKVSTPFPPRALPHVIPPTRGRSPPHLSIK